MNKNKNVVVGSFVVGGQHQPRQRFCVSDKISFTSFVKCQKLRKKVALQILFETYQTLYFFLVLDSLSNVLVAVVV